MYRNFYQLNSAPFATVDHPEPLFLSSRHQTALEHIAAGVHQKQGLLVLTGDAGLGKTTLLRSVLTPSHQLQIFTINDGDLSHHLSPKELLRAIKQKLGLECPDSSPAQPLAEMINDVQEFFIQAGKRGTNVALIIDDAHLLPLATLSILPQIITIFPYRQKFAQLILVGQSGLETTLHHPQLKELQSQIGTLVTLPRLKNKESRAYIKAKLVPVAKRRKPIMSTRGLNTIIKHAHGIPRTLNILCTDALTAGFQQQQQTISKRLVHQVIAEFEDKPLNHPKRLTWISVMSLFILFSLAIVLSRTDRWPGIAEAQQAMAQWAQPHWQQLTRLARLTRDAQPKLTTRTPELPTPRQGVASAPAATTTALTSPPLAQLTSPRAATPSMTPTPLVTRPAELSPGAPPPKAVEPATVLPHLTGTLQQVATLMRQAFHSHDPSQLQVWANQGSRGTYTEGEKLLVHVLSTTDAYIQVDYYQADGQVIHLLPNALDHNRIKSGQIFTLGKSDNTFQFEIAPPFGVEMLTVIASQMPIDREVGGPTIEPAAGYLKRLTRQLQSIQNQGRAAAAYLPIQTQKEFPTRLSQTVNP